MAKNKKKWVYIEWRDTYGPTENKWISPSVVEDQCSNDNAEVLIKQVGLLLHKGKYYTTITHQISETTDPDGSRHIDMIGTYTRISNRMIVKIQPLDVQETEKDPETLML